MTAQLMDGAALADETFARIAEGTVEFLAVAGRRPCLVTVLVGDDPSSHVYVRMKVTRSGKVGIESRRIDLPQATTTAELVAVLKELSDDRSVDGILRRPVGMLLLARDSTVTFCHSKTRDLADAVRDADIVIAAVGRPELIRGDWIKPGAVVVDAGYNAGNVGDVEFAAAATRAKLITPVPGGVGPMTIAVLLDQTVDAARSHG